MAKQIKKWLAIMASSPKKLFLTLAYQIKEWLAIIG